MNEQKTSQMPQNANTHFKWDCQKNNFKCNFKQSSHVHPKALERGQLILPHDARALQDSQNLYQELEY